MVLCRTQIPLEKEETITSSAQQGYSTSSISLALPYTGLDLAPFAVVAVALIAVGVYLRKVTHAR